VHGTTRSTPKAPCVDGPSAIYLSEEMADINDGSSFLDRLSPDEIGAVRRASRGSTLSAGESLFVQGEPHDGIYLIESGCVRTYYVAPSGREITLALWTAGHFVGGPEIFGGGTHVWSALAMEPTRVAFLPGPALRDLAQTIPAFAICLIEGLVAKGKCYSALVQMLGTRSVTERLAQLLLILGRADMDAPNKPIVIDRAVTHEQLANIVGSTRQWVTSTLARFQKRGIVKVTRDRMVILDPSALRGDL
jgi:CRP/FNR family cyclic AMP-dependent transcriptional regulator